MIATFSIRLPFQTYRHVFNGARSAYLIPQTSSISANHCYGALKPAGPAPNPRNPPAFHTSRNTRKYSEGRPEAPDKRGATH